MSLRCAHDSPLASATQSPLDTVQFVPSAQSSVGSHHHNIDPPMKHFLFLLFTFCSYLVSAFATDGKHWSVAAENLPEKSEPFSAEAKRLPAAVESLPTAAKPLSVDAIQLIPAPTSYVKTRGAMKMSGPLRLVTNVKGKDRQWLCQQWAAAFPALKMDKRAESVLRILLMKTNQTKSEEGYQLRITPRAIHIEATTMTGVFYALQTLRQLEAQGSVACCEIKDAPQYPYRGLMLDCSRHFWTKEFILKQLDAMAYLKMNRLHLHLTDDAGWRMEIKQYPALTEKTAWRVGANWAEWREQGQRYAHQDDKGASGGYYTQQDLREIVAYAAARHITVVPEIEMPGHSAEVLFAYPELQCAQAQARNSDLCVGNEQTFVFLENVLREVMQVFPSRYLHIGGDEASRQAWSTCPRCQQRMQAEGLNSVAELQAYLTQRVARFLHSQGRTLLGWDEILEGQLPPNAVVMSWRGEEGGIAAAKAGHDVIMTPGRYCYLDRYQDYPPSQPKAFGSYMSLEQCYDYDPAGQLPDSIARHILGLQGNLWTEQVPTMAHCEYMLYPRLLAIAENGWSRAKTNYADFHRRALHLQDVLVSRGYHPFDLRKEVGERAEKKAPMSHLAVGKRVVYHAPYAANYPASGNGALVDGKSGGWDFQDGTWQGFIGADRVDVTIDLGAVTPLRLIEAAFFQSVSAEIYAPAEVVIQVSDDGVHFEQLYQQHNVVDLTTDFKVQTLEWRGERKARFIRYQVKAGAQGGWIFTDEIRVE